ncbi:MAG: TerD family protein [Alphaproteobacteria bacterium]|nr:TerD family protein [Alphaproteobacteria bacterium]
MNPMDPDNKENKNMSSEGSNPAPEVGSNPAPEVGSNPAPSNPAPEVESNPAPSTPAPEAPPAPVVETPVAAEKTLATTADEDNDEPEMFDASRPEERFNKVSQGDTVELLELAPQLKKGIVGVGWDLIGFDESAADLDVSLFLLDKNDQTREDEDFVFYGNLETLDGGINHSGDSRSGAGSGDDEQIIIDFSVIPFDVTKIVVTLTIYDPDTKGYSFNNVRNVYMRLEDKDKDTEQELFRYFLDKELKAVPKDIVNDTNELCVNALYIGCFRRDANSWIFDALGEMDEGGLAKIATKYGMVIGAS